MVISSTVTETKKIYPRPSVKKSEVLCMCQQCDVKIVMLRYAEEH